MIPKELLKKIRRIEIRMKGLVEDVFGGEYHSAFKGQGMEFSEVRQYQVGDDIRAIDWNVSARTGEAHIKIFEEEREQTVMLVVDVSGSEDFGSRNQLKREMAAEICAVVAFSAIKNDDKVGLILFSDQVELFVPPKKGRKHVLRLIRDLFAHEPQSQGTDLGVSLNHVLHVLKRRSIVVLISDFLAEDFEKPLRAVSRRHDTIAIHLNDPREEALPDVGLIDLTDPETGETIVIDTSSRAARHAYEHSAMEQRRHVDDIFRRVRADRIQIHTDQGYVEPLIRFFRKRNKLAR